MHTINSAFLRLALVSLAVSPQLRSEQQKAKTDGAVFVSYVVVDGEKLPLYEGVKPEKTVTPIYPYEDYASKREGSVTLGAVVGVNGAVTGTFIIKKAGATPKMQQSAMNAVKQWLFPPMPKDGSKVKYVAMTPIVFTFR